jgi:hypothetical protein
MMLLQRFNELGRCDCKALFGLKQGMVRVTDKDAAYRLFRPLNGKIIFYIQRYIPHGNQGSTDICYWQQGRGSHDQKRSRLEMHIAMVLTQNLFYR